MTGEVVVAGLVTGTHLIQDIGVTVPHRVAVRIPAEVALQSKDLWRGIQQGFLFKLSAGAGLSYSSTSAPAPTPTPPPVPAPAQSRFEIENQTLRAENLRLANELSVERQRNLSLQTLLTNLTSGLAGVQTALGKLEASPRVVVAGTAEARATGPEVVGGAVPTFIPAHVLPENVEAQIHTEKETTDRSNLSSAASRLRDMRRQSGG